MVEALDSSAKLGGRAGLEEERGLCKGRPLCWFPKHNCHASFKTVQCLNISKEDEFYRVAREINVSPGNSTFQKS